MTQQQSPSGQQQVQVKATDEVLKGAYANMAQIVHTAEEFVVDFMNIVPPTGNLVSRVIVSPAHAKRIAQVLTENVKKYEEVFGAIKASENPDHKIGFRTE